MNTELNFAELRKDPHWSFSALNSILNICSMQYAFGRIYKEIPEFVPMNLVFGKAFHRGASYLYNLHKDMQEPEENELNDFFAHALQTEVNDSRFDVPLAEGKEIDDYILKGQEMLQALAENLDPDDEVVDTDVPFRVNLPGSKPLIGEFDAVVENKGRIIIVDFKTSASKWPAIKCHKDLQATAYLYALRQGIDSRESLFRYDVITKAKTPTVTRYMTNRTQTDFNRFIQLVHMADRVVEQEMYYPHETSFACGGCQYSGACTSWQTCQAGKAQQVA
ncbi:hypothetical protein LNTAR_16373 [Lentisphaera araneosa HTCC2155]|uniref:PD-(D/E)XK endonuclease-like domain-containing protein n=1 Tax=Lentisphaera araneosa HTCC2155 TaxID=313628 RepID=A6DQ89_9BACT|nr:PD-(D/E)XK nuclease family protein [Lentisphaera araneosa]EDM26140.1 hypothetical protein LNTAR_16373 [Lentisphaera araneosa HTCC2155]